jgi:hypothetical protein
MVASSSRNPYAPPDRPLLLAIGGVEKIDAPPLLGAGRLLH